MSTTHEIALLDTLNAYYDAQYTRAETLLSSDQATSQETKEEGQRILKALYDDTTISLFLRAKVNYCLAIYGDGDDGPRYMRQCLEMLHVYCDSGREETRDVRVLEELAVEFLKHYYLFLAEEEEDVEEDEWEDEGQEVVEKVERMRVTELELQGEQLVAVSELKHGELCGANAVVPEDMYIGMYPRRLRWYEQPGA